MSFAKVRLERNGDVLIGSLAGDVDLTNAPDVADQLMPAIPNSVKVFVLDLSETTHLDSRGVQVLLELVERLHMRKQTAYLVAPERSAIRRILAVVGVTDSLPVTGTVDEALEQIRIAADRSPRSP